MKLYNKKDFLKLPEGTVYFDKPYEKKMGLENYTLVICT